MPIEIGGVVFNHFCLLRRHRFLATVSVSTHLPLSFETLTSTNVPVAASNEVAGVSDATEPVSELRNRFENCQQMLNSISGSIGSKAMTVDGQKRKLEDSEKLLEQRRLFYNTKIVSHPKSNKPEEERN